jgi:hypothetical protein
VTNIALRVLLPAASSKDKKESIVMNTQLHKVCAFVNKQCTASPLAPTATLYPSQQVSRTLHHSLSATASRLALGPHHHSISCDSVPHWPPLAPPLHLHSPSIALFRPLICVPHLHPFLPHP